MARFRFTSFRFLAAIAVARVASAIVAAVPASGQLARLSFLSAGAEHQKQAADPAAAEVEASLKRATAAAEQAWALSTHVDKESDKILKAAGDVDGEVAMAKAAQDTAEKEDKKATELFYKTRTSAIQAATFAARAYYDEVLAAGAAADANRKKALAKAAEQAEVNAAKAAAAAAMPYHQQLLRGQKVIVDYMKKAQALGAAGVSLKKEAFKLSQNAETYQQNAQLPEASQMMMQAHSVFEQGEAYEAQAGKLSSAANELNAALPNMQLAGQAAAESAAMAANPLTKDYLTEFHPY